MSGTRASTLMAAVTPAEVRELRVARRQTVTAAAASIGVSRRTWHRWESGHAPPDPRAVREYEYSVMVFDGPVVDEHDTQSALDEFREFQLRRP